MHLKHLMAVLSALVVPAIASAESNVRYTNLSGRPLHLYYAVAPHGEDLTCQDLEDGGVLPPGEVWNHFVPDQHWTWVKFVENPIEGSCDSERFQAIYNGDDFAYPALNVW